MPPRAGPGSSGKQAARLCGARVRMRLRTTLTRLPLGVKGRLYRSADFAYRAIDLRINVKKKRRSSRYMCGDKIALGGTGVFPCSRTDTP